MKLTVKKLFAFILIWAFVFISCDNEAVNKDADKDEESKQGYLTITYHSEGHTEGEVPVDDTRYPIVATGFILGAPYKAKVTILEPGTLKKRGSSFSHWEIEDTGMIDPVYIKPLSLDPFSRDYFLLWDANSKQIELHAVWEDF